MEKIMHSRDFGPGEPGWVAPQERGETPQNEEPRAAATHARLERNIDKTIDEHEGTGNRSQAQRHAIRHLVERYSVSAAVAAIIAAELGMGGAL
jgi:hypothetical protein